MSIYLINLNAIKCSINTIQSLTSTIILMQLSWNWLNTINLLIVYLFILLPQSLIQHINRLSLINTGQAKAKLVGRKQLSKLFAIYGLNTNIFQLNQLLTANLLNSSTSFYLKLMTTSQATLFYLHLQIITISTIIGCKIFYYTFFYSL